MSITRKTGEQRRSEILAAAKNLFATRGFEGTTTRAIAEQAGVNEAIIFRHFPTKLMLFHAVVQESGFHSQLPLPLESLMKMPLDSLLTVLLSHFLDLSWENRTAIKMMIAEAGRDSVASGGLSQTQLHPRERLQILLEALEAQGVVRTGQARAGASVIAAAALGFLTRSFREEPENWAQERATFVSDLVRLIVPSLRAETPFVPQSRQTDKREKED
jgi:AcrR family transcriptional regulator